MKKRILVAIFFTILMLMIHFSATARQANTCIYSQSMNLDQAELPDWSIGDFWEYDMSMILSKVISIDVKRMEARVTEITENEYTLSISGYLDGFVLLITGYDYSKLVPAKFVSGYAHVEKSTLAMKDYTLIITGNLKGITIVDFDIELSMDFDPAIDFFDFPISINENPWSIATNVDFTINGNVNFNGNNKPVEFEMLNNSISDELLVTNNEVITVPAGNFESFLISSDQSNLWYNSSVGYLVKLNGHLSLKVGFDCDQELLSTNFNHPENNAPAIPDIDGPTNGAAGGEYEYTISTTDPNGEQVYYKIDWGDGTCSDWLGPYPSGDEVIVKHTWKSKATYKIRAKAKDVNGYQTAWSDILPVTMPKNKLFNFNFNLLSWLFERFPNAFPILRHLLELQ